MKNTTIWTVCLRLSLARINGRISSIDAPVVPMMLAKTVPNASKPVFNAGVPCRLPRTQMPPATTNSAVIRMMKGKNSALNACSAPLAAVPAPKNTAHGNRNANAQANDTLPKWWCQNTGFISGSNAIDNNKPANGMLHHMLNWLPSSSEAWHHTGTRLVIPNKNLARNCDLPYLYARAVSASCVCGDVAGGFEIGAYCSGNVALIANMHIPGCGRSRAFRRRAQWLHERDTVHVRPAR